MWALILVVFATCSWLFYLIVARLMGPRLVMADRLATVGAVSRPAAQAPFRWSSMPAADRIMGRLDFSRSLELLLDQADLPMKPFEFVLLVTVCALGLTAAGLVAGRGTGIEVLMGMLGFLAPIVWVRLRRRGRRDAFNRQIPDALQAIGNSLRAGYGFGQGMAVVANDLPRPVSTEFARALREMNLGMTVEDVLRDTARRMQSVDFELAVSGILINRQVGGNLAELLDHITATIRERVKLQAFIRVLTAEQRLSALVIMAVPPVLFVILFVAWRQYVQYLLITRIGLVLLALAFVMQVVGIYFIRRIVDIEV